MKTTIEIPDSLLAKAKQVATSERTSLRALVEEGLRHVLKRRDQHAFKLRRASFKGRGLHPDVQEGSWETLRDLVYEGRGA